MIIRNSLANFLGQLLYPILNIILVPLYLHYLGLEGYGLIGFFTMLVSLLSVSVKGMGSALQREIAQRWVSGKDRLTLRRLLRTFELTYWVIGAILALGLIIFSGIISKKWVHVESIPPSTIYGCIILIALRIALAFPNAVYQAFFIGMQEQVLGNVLNCINAVISACLGAFVVYMWQSILIFYLIGILSAFCFLFILRYFVHKMLLSFELSVKPEFNWGELKRLWQLSVGLIWTNGIGLIVTQLDRVMISSFLTVSSLGIYNVGIAGGRLLGMSCSPFLVAVYPQICQVAKNKGRSQLGAHLIKNTKVITILCLAVGLPISFFSPEILELWTHNPIIVNEGAKIMGLYVYGNIFISMANVLYQGQMALGISRYGVIYNTIALIWFPILVWFLIKAMGLQGAAWAWVTYCGLSWLYNIIICTVVLLKGFPLSRYLKTVSLNAGCSIIIIIITRHLSNRFFNEWIWGRVLIACAGSMIIFVGCALLSFGYQNLLEAAIAFKKSKFKLIPKFYS